MTTLAGPESVDGGLDDSSDCLQLIEACFVS